MVEKVLGRLWIDDRRNRFESFDKNSVSLNKVTRRMGSSFCGSRCVTSMDFKVLLETVVKKGGL